MITGSLFAGKLNIISDIILAEVIELSQPLGVISIGKYLQTVYFHGLAEFHIFKKIHV